MWNCDGVTDSPADYQARFDAETAAWVRPGFVTAGPGNTYLSLFVANETGPWQARHNMTPAEYQTQFDTLTADGYFPVCVQAAGADAASARFAALFVQQQEIVPRQFTATGPVTNAGIDSVVQAVMQTYPTVRHAALAIVHGTSLVYARGYTLAEPDWPIVQPTTYFRLASTSKVITALAIFQLLEQGALDAATSVQEVLQRKAIGGQSMQTAPQPLVADGYGDIELEISRGSGGLSGAATDVARLVAILLDTSDNAAIKRGTLEQMLSQAAVLLAAREAIATPDARAGSGLDAAQWKSPGIYYGQKGGLITDAASVFQFDGEWGFVALFGSSAYRPYGVVYPDWPDVMKIARMDPGAAPDLFPQFGMPSL